MATQFLGTRYQSFKADGTVNALGTVQFFEVNSATHKQTYSNSSLTTENADPVILDSGGCADIWYSGNADATVYDSAGVLIDTFEDINPTELSEWVDGPEPTYVSTTSFTLIGDQTSTFHVGRRVKTTNTGGTIYSTISTVAYTSLTTVTVVNDSGTLDSGLSHVQYGNISATNTSIPGVEITGDDWTFQGTIKNEGLVKWSKGVDIASTAALSLGTDGNYFDITGTTTITSIGTVGIGSWIKLHFDDVLILTHHATDLILPGGANYTTAAGDEFTFVEYATNDWRCTGYTLASGKSVSTGPNIQIFTTTGTYTTPAGVTWIEVFGIGPAGGAGAGARTGYAADAYGGGAGGRGAVRRAKFQASNITSPVTVTIGAAGVGAAGRATGGTGANGTDGATTSFGAYLLIPAGTKGFGGSSTAAGANGAPAGSDIEPWVTPGTASAGADLISLTQVAGVAGGGALIPSSVAAAGGGTAGAAGGSTDGTSGAAGSATDYAGAGGGSGGSRGNVGSGDAGDGGDGGAYGGAPGGGGGLTSSDGAALSGAGGDGGASILIVVSY